MLQLPSFLLNQRWLAACSAAFLLQLSTSTMAERLLWFDSGKPTAQAKQALTILAAAADDGLDPRDYAAEPLRRAIETLQVASQPTAETFSQVDAALTAAMELYLTELHFGRIQPDKVGANFDTPATSFDPAAYLRRALAEQRLGEAVRGAAPAVPLYADLRKALAHFRGLARNPALQHPLPPLPKRKLEGGESYVGLPALITRLSAFGDLPSGSHATTYTPAIQEGIKSFQRRHGLKPDGVLGRDTFEQLNVSAAQRVRQLELTLERLRWTPLAQGPRMIVINVPEFVLRGFEIRDGRYSVKTAMKVIVGKALDTRTPIFSEEMRHIEFSPYWNVPPSIAASETIPRLRREPGYFGKQGFEFVGNDGKVSTELTQANLDAVLKGLARIRQRPGPNNALGDIKFVFPNNDNIYLHHTPSVRLFERDRRDFSHGCIRVEQPVALAQFVLHDRPDWDESRIRSAMERGVLSTLKLKQPLPVVVAYSTSIVKGDGRIYFFRDIYGHDRLLDEALQQRRGTIFPLPFAGAPTTINRRN